jgi:olfactory receptor
MPLFLVFFTVYVISVLENLSMIWSSGLILNSTLLCTFFLGHLSFVYFCCTTVIARILLDILLGENKIVFLCGCTVQFCFRCVLVVMWMLMLAVMAYNRFVAVCNPLLYTVVLPHKLCSILVAVSYFVDIVCAVTLTIFFQNCLIVDIAC